MGKKDRVIFFFTANNASTRATIYPWNSAFTQKAVAFIPVLTVYSCPRILEEEHEISITRTLVQKVPIFLSRYGG